MKIVLDVSAAAEIIFCRPSRKKLASVVANADLVLAPSLFVVEAANLIFKYHREKLFEEGKQFEYYNECLKLVDLFIPNEELSLEVLSMACNNKKPVYDYYYLVLARRNSATLLTQDKVLQSEAKKHGVNA